ncbi:hypothetical protein B7486_49700 [cyanobacterium TDX16]|nr:hypothetical protein B7486_49700 [cyanobacterium TDX16]
MILGELKTFLNLLPLANNSNYSFKWSVTWGKSLIIADEAWVVGMFRTTAKEEPTAKSFGLTTTQFDRSPLVISLSLRSCPSTQPVPIIRVDGSCQVFSVTGLEINRSGLSLVDGEDVGLFYLLLQPPPAKLRLDYRLHQPQTMPDVCQL